MHVRSGSAAHHTGFAGEFGSPPLAFGGSRLRFLELFLKRRIGGMRRSQRGPGLIGKGDASLLVGAQDVELKFPILSQARQSLGLGSELFRLFSRGPVGRCGRTLKLTQKRSILLLQRLDGRREPLRVLVEPHGARNLQDRAP